MICKNCGHYVVGSGEYYVHRVELPYGNCLVKYKDTKRCSKCKCVAKYQNNNKYYCAKHRVNDTIMNGKKECIGHMKNGKPCKPIPKYYLQDKFYCNRHKVDDSILIQKTKTLKVKKINCSNVDMHDLYIKITNKFDKLPELLNVDNVILELQGTHNPRFSNIKMKTISTIIHQYFVIRGMVDTQRIKNIKYVHAKTALSCYDGPEIKISDKTASGATKSKRTIKKETGFEQVKYILKDDKEHLEYILNDANAHAKYDLCDAFLLCNSYVKRNILKDK